MEKIVKLTPLIYALLIFSGYLNYVSYYRHFGIQIVSYLTTSELLLSFLPLTSALLFLFLLMAVFFLITLAEIANGRTNSSRNLEDAPNTPPKPFQFIGSFKQIRKDIKTFEWKFGKIFWLLFEIVIFLVSLAMLVFFIGYAFVLIPLIVENKVMSGTVLYTGLMLSFFWFLLLFDITMKAADKLVQPISNRVILIVFIVSFLSLMAIYNKQQASNIVLGEAQYQIALDVKDKVIKTDSNFLYVGKTENYFIFFDRKNSKSVLYPTSEVSTIQINKVK